MQRCASVIVLLSILAAMNGCKESSEPKATFGKEYFMGRWIPDAEKTLELKKKGPNYEPGKDDMLSDIVKNAMKELELQITDTEIVYLRGGRKQTYPYTVVSADSTRQCLTVIAEVGGKDGEITLMLIDGEYLNLKSAGSESGNLFVWKHVAESP